MAFTENIRSIEQIKNSNTNNFVMQELQMIEPLSNMAKSAIDSDNIAITFAKLVSTPLSKSFFSIFGKVLLDNEIEFVSDAIGHGDILSFSYNSKKQIDRIEFQNSDKNIKVILKVCNEKAIVSRVINMEDIIYETKSVFKKHDDFYYQKSFCKKILKKQDDYLSTASEEYKYDIDKDELVKDYSVITKENGKTISKSSIKSLVDKSDYVTEDGIFYTINKKQENVRMKKCKILENKLVDYFN